MERRQAEIAVACEKCGNEIVIDKIWTAGGLNDYGGFIVECGNCLDVAEVRIGRDVSASRVRSGGRKIDSYDDELNNRENVLRRHQLIP